MSGPGGRGNPIVLVVAVFVLVATLISFANRRQRPILWLAFFVVAVMTLYPPWLGEQVVWVAASQKTGQGESAYRHVSASMGYAPLWSPPRRGYSNTFKPMAVHWARLLAQIVVVVLVTAGLILTRGRKGPRWEDPRASAAGKE